MILQTKSFLFAAVVCLGVAAFAANGQTLSVTYPSASALTAPLSQLPDSPHKPGTRPHLPLPPHAPSSATRDLATQTASGPRVSATNGVSFDGPGANGFAPSDNNMAVGPNHIFAAVNSVYQIFSKSGASILGPKSLSSLWTGVGGGCATANAGDVIVQYDKLADRWVLTQLSSLATPYGECIAVSTSGDPTGTYNTYYYSFGNVLPDYPKFGVWPTTSNAAYLATYNRFNNGTTFAGASLCAYDRTAMVNGAATPGQICFVLGNDGGYLPSDLDGSTPPADGTPGQFITYETLSSLRIWKIAPNFANPNTSTLTQATPDLAVPSFTELCGGGTCVPQAGTSNQLDSLGDRLMYRLAYRNFGSYQAMVFNHSVTSGPRWYELRANPGGAFGVYQQGTYAPDGTYRWMGSAAMDGAGDLALGYSASSSIIHPAVRYTGRLPGDPLGTLQSEASIIEGTGSQTGTLTRWGDYSALRIDPADDCTFWYINEYLKSDGSFNWSTRIGSFAFNSCRAPDFSLSASPPALSIAQGNAGSSTITVTSLSGFNSAVSLGVSSGCPAFATCSLVPGSVTPPPNGTTTSTLTVTTNVGGTTPAGTTSLVVSANGGIHTISVPVTITAGVFGNGYNFGATFTVAAGKVPATQTNFPALISGTFADLKTIANGGKVANTCTQTVGNSATAVPCDLIFTSDAAGTSLLNWEFESWNAATGAVNIWVNVPTISNGSVIYGWYGNSAVTTLQTLPASTWNGNFTSVYHLKENPAGAAPQLNDSAPSALNASAGVPTPAGQQVAGKIGGSLDLNRTYYFTLGNASSWNFDRTDSFSVSCWCMTTSNNAGDVLAKQQAAAPFTGWQFFTRNGVSNPTFALDLISSGSGTVNRLAMLTPEISQNTWHHVVATYGGGSAPSSVHIYVDGVDQPLTSIANSLTASIANAVVPEIGGRNGNNLLGAGKVDEARVYAKGVVLSSGWVTTEYNNQSNPSAFFNAVTGLTNQGNSSPVVSLSAPSLTFGNQTTNTTSAPQSVTVTNNGPGALTITGVSVNGSNAGDFAQTNNCPATLAVSSSCSISVTFTPTAAGSRAAAVSISDNGSGSPQSFSVSGTGVAPVPTVGLSPQSLTFANQTTNTTSAAQSITVTNNGPGALSITGISVIGANAGDFAQSNTCPVSPATLAVNATCSISVTFTPTAAGSRVASVSISDDGSGSPQSVALSGTGVAPVPTAGLSPQSLTFANQMTNTTSAAQSVTVTNNGPGTLSITGISITGTNAGDFAQTNTCPVSPATLAVNATCSISVTFTPTTTGSRVASVSISDNGSGSPQSVALSGTGVVATINPWPNGYNYKATFTVSAGKIPATQTNFPALISGTFADLRTIANGGKVANTCTQTVGNSAMAVPCDLIFTSDAAGGSLLSWEFESWNAATGAVNIWVNVPTISNGSVIYGWYGNSAVTTLQTLPASTWNGNFTSVYHLKENPAGAAPQLNDSAASALNASAGVPTPAGQQVAGKVGGSIDLNRTYYFTVGNASTWNFDRTDSFSVSCWCMTTSNNAGDVLAKQQSGAPFTGWQFFARNGVSNPTFALDLVSSGSGTVNRLAMLTPEVSQNTWHHVVATYSGGSAPSSVHIYVDGVDQPLTSIANSLTASIVNAVVPEIGGRNGNNLVGAGKVDEARVYAKGVVLSAGWVTAEYNNQSNPSAFFTAVTGLTN